LQTDNITARTIDGDLDDTLRVMRELVLNDARNMKIRQFAADMLKLKGINPTNRDAIANLYYNFLLKKIAYVPDPFTEELVQDFQTSMQTEIGDCDDQSVALATLLNVIGIPVRYKVAAYVIKDQFSHVYLEYQNSQGKWIPADLTAAKGVGFEYPYVNNYTIDIESSERTMNATYKPMHLGSDDPVNTAAASAGKEIGERAADETVDFIDRMAEGVNDFFNDTLGFGSKHQYVPPLTTAKKQAIEKFLKYRWNVTWIDKDHTMHTMKTQYIKNLLAEGLKKYGVSTPRKARYEDSRNFIQDKILMKDLRKKLTDIEESIPEVSARKIEIENALWDNFGTVFLAGDVHALIELEEQLKKNVLAYELEKYGLVVPRKASYPPTGSQNFIQNEYIVSLLETWLNDLKNSRKPSGIKVSKPKENQPTTPTLAENSNDSVVTLPAPKRTPAPAISSAPVKNPIQTFSSTEPVLQTASFASDDSNMSTIIGVGAAIGLAAYFLGGKK
jgi:hypothetical protein